MTKIHQIAAFKDKWGPLYITDEGNVRSLNFSEDSPQSSMWLDAPFDLNLEYTQLMMASLLFVPNLQSALLFGLGGGSIAKFLWKTFPRCHVHSVEMRAKLVNWAYEYFFLPRSPRVHNHVCDALEFLHKTPLQLFDLIVVDLFDKEGMSAALVDNRFFDLCNRFLDPKGVVVWNLWRSANPSFLEKCISDLVKAFGNNLVYLPSKREGNLTIIALPKPLSSYKLSLMESKAQKLNEKTQLNFPFLMKSYNNFIHDPKSIQGLGKFH